MFRVVSLRGKIKLDVESRVLFVILVLVSSAEMHAHRRFRREIRYQGVTAKNLMFAAFLCRISSRRYFEMFCHMRRAAIRIFSSRRFILH